MNYDSAPWVDGLTFREVLSRTVGANGDRDAVVFPQLGLRWSFVEFERRVQETARALMALGVGKGDHVGIWSTNWPEWILVQFATGFMGAVLVNVNPAYRRHELAYILKQADLKVLIVTDRFKTSDYHATVAEVVPAVEDTPHGTALSSAEFPELQHVVSIKETPSQKGIWPWGAFLENGCGVAASELTALSESVVAGDPVNIQYTSGTTGDPKGATLSHRNLLMNAYYIGERMRVSQIDRIAIPVPFYHCFGCVLGTLLCVVYGSAMVIPAESFEPEPTLAAVETEKCTALYGVPTMFSAQIHSPDFQKYDLASLRTGIMAGSPCPIELMKQVTKDMHLTEMTIAFGQTEASPGITMSHTTDSLEARVSTVGSELPGVEVRIVDPESGEDVALGEQGELWARGHCVMLGYYKMPEATAAAIDKDGWLHTGDLSTQNADGDYKITGRIKDMIIRGGENIYPAEIEDFLLRHQKIREAQDVGLPDERFVEQVSAWVIPVEPGTLDADEIRTYCKDQIAHYKVPYYIEVIDEYPLTVTGKVQKFRLREMGIERHGLEAAARQETA